MKITPTPRCPECDHRISAKYAETHPLLFDHALDCSSMTLERAVVIGKHIEASARTESRRASDAWRVQYQERCRMELAYRRVKEENNALRKKLYPGKC